MINIDFGKLRLFVRTLTNLSTGRVRYYVQNKQVTKNFYEAILKHVDEKREEQPVKYDGKYQESYCVLGPTDVLYNLLNEYASTDHWTKKN